MTSILAQQLQALGRPGAILPRAKGKPSLLFEAQQAADIDLLSIYDIASQGGGLTNVGGHSLDIAEDSKSPEVVSAFLCTPADEAVLAGLAELCEINEAFKPFTKTLFRRDRVGVEREQQTRAANEKTDASLAAFLTLLSPHFMREAATKVLEFLIRQYRYEHYGLPRFTPCISPQPRPCRL